MALLYVLLGYCSITGLTITIKGYMVLQSPGTSYAKILMHLM